MRAEEITNTDIGLIKIQKPGATYEQEFEGFFMFEEEELQSAGLMPYNAVRDIVNRYVKAVTIYDKQLAAAIEMNEILDQYFTTNIALTIIAKELLAKRMEFKKEIQKSGWEFIFDKLNMKKYATRGLKEDINKFVELQIQVPFTMRNIYRMLEIVVGTNTQRMDKALLEVFDKITAHHSDNRYNIEGWKTNSHYLMTRKFILPNMCWQDQRWYKGEQRIRLDHNGNLEFVEDMLKALCFISGDEYDSFGSLRDWVFYQYKTVTEKGVFFHQSVENYDGQAERAEALHNAGIAYTLVNHQPVYGEWFEWAYFRVKAFKKGSMHFEFKDEELWGRFNQRIARLKGYPLFEAKKQTAYQRRQTRWDNSKSKCITVLQLLPLKLIVCITMTMRS